MSQKSLKKSSPGLTESNIRNSSKNVQLDEYEYNTIKNAFDLFDVDKNGTISANELKLALKKIGLDAEDKFLSIFIDELDSNKNGILDFDEFLEFALKRVDEKDSKEEIQKIFNYYDSNSKGYITKEDLNDIAKYLGENMNDSDINKMFNLLNLKNDGKVTMEDFYSMMIGKIY